MAMKQINYQHSLSELKAKAKNHGLAIRKYERGEDSFMFVDMRTNFAVDPYPLTFEELAAWLDKLDDDANTAPMDAE